MGAPPSSLKGACGISYGVKRGVGVSLVGRAGDTVLCVFPFLPPRTTASSSLLLITATKSFNKSSSN